MKKIAFVYFSMNPAYVDILNNLNSGCDVYFLTSNLSSLNVKKEITEIKLSDSKLSFFGRFMFRNKLIKNLIDIKPEIIYVSDLFRAEFFQVLYYYYFYRNSNVKIVLYTEIQRLPRNIFVNFFGRFLVNFLFKYFLSKSIYKIACFTSDGISFYKNLLPNRVNDIYLFPQVIDTKKFYFQKNSKFLLNNKLNLLIVARMVPYKNYFDLFDALAYLKLEFNFKDFHLNILGFGPMESDIKKKIKKLDLENEVTFLKKIPNDKMINYFVENDVLVLPSFNEAIGMVVPEAMSCGIPVIISDTVGAKTYVENNKTGFIFKTGDYVDLANKILKLNDKKKLILFGKNASKVIENKFSLNSVKDYFKKVL